MTCKYCQKRLYHSLSSKFINAHVCISIPWSEHRLREVFVMDGIRPFLGFESEGATVSDSFSSLSGIAAVEEVSAVELDAALVCEDFHASS